MTDLNAIKERSKQYSVQAEQDIATLLSDNEALRMTLTLAEDALGRCQAYINQARIDHAYVVPIPSNGDTVEKIENTLAKIKEHLK